MDLLGIRPGALTPVIIELKDRGGMTRPLRGIVEGAAYAVALRKAWRHRLREDWRHALAEHLPGDVAERIDALPAALDDVTVLVAAPEDYWNRRIGTPLTRTNGRVPPDAWPVLRALLSGLGERGIRIVCASLRAAGRKKVARSCLAAHKFIDAVGATGARGPHATCDVQHTIVVPISCPPYGMAH